MPRVEIKAPLVHQVPVDESPASRKVLRAGRRWGKTRWAFKGSIVGHGPMTDEGMPKFLGVIHGLDVVWIARDYKQAGTLWQEEIIPRFADAAPAVKINEQDRRVEFKDHGKLYIRSAENINSVRGVGDSLVGVIIDEGAHLNLQKALLEVVLPVLLDNEGWLVLMSTTNAGPDGYVDADVGKRTPSYFNIICEEIQKGKRSDSWAEFHGTAHDNPVISEDAIQELIEEYPEGSPDLAQEVYAKLLSGGAGVAFPEWDDSVHLTTFRPEGDPNWRWSAGGDWGYTAPGGLWLMATGPERSIVRHEFYFKKKTPYEVGYEWAKMIQRFPAPEWVAVDTPAVSDGGPTILEGLQKGMNDGLAGQNVPPFINPPKGAGSRLTKKTLLHEALRFTRSPDGTVEPWALPKLLVHATDCPDLVRTIQRIPRDPKRPDDVDTTAEDHPYDGVTSWLMARTPAVEREPEAPKHPDDHQGWDGWVDGGLDLDSPRWTREVM